ncbi:MAG: phosphate acyltransferase PlsX [Firmicutes bacterium]|nr:phosphate acyltransferase PlsX [Bacillota bacterium]
MERLKIILDAMGGDNAPEAPVLGALEAVKDFGAEITLVGRGEEILAVLKKHGIETLPEGVEIANADDVVDMHDDPASIIHKRKNSSMVVGLKMLADGQGDAFVSAGSTGALLTGATLLVKRVKGIRRAAMGPAMPNKAGGKTVILDCGANAECTPEFLLQFGLVGSLYAKKQLGVENPRVGLLNIGAEDSKGTSLQKEAYALLQNASEQGLVNFVGNVEARDVPLGAVDVIVCDGFAGNVLLKSIEGTAMFMGSMMKKMFKKNLLSKLGYLLCASGVKDMMKLLDYREIGGTPFLGIRKPVIKAHGSSDALAFRNAVKQAADAASADISAELEAELQRLAAAKEGMTEHD